MLHKIILIAILIAYPAVESAKILVLAPFFGKSHSIFINTIVSELAGRKHDITLITSNLIQDAPPNIHQIDAKDALRLMKNFDSKMMFKLDQISIVSKVSLIWPKMINTTDMYLSLPAVKKFIEEDNSHYDLVISELFFQEAFYAFAYKYQAPLILLGTNTHWEVVDSFMGNPSTLSYSSHEFFNNYGDLNLYERLSNFWVGNLYNLGTRLYVTPKQDKLIIKHFSSLPKPLPTVSELVKNVSLVLFNTHFTFDFVKPTVPGVIEVGGLHLKPAKQLPQHLKTFMDGASEGVIYFSMGSYLQSKDMSEETLDIFIKVFSSLKQRVIWKWEDDNPPFKIDNVLTAKWLPQSDILAHPKVRVFITQTGMLSTQEAVHRGVPIIGIPVYGDQHLNIAKLVYHGIGLKLPYSDISEDRLRDAIDKVLNDPKYKNNVKEMSNRFHDQINTPLETAIFWIEYVIRHKGAKFMKSRLPAIPLYQYYFLDIYAVYAVIIMFIYFMIRLTLKLLFKKKITNKITVNKGKKHKKQL